MPQGSTLRLFKHGSVFLSTFQKNPAKDPETIYKVDVGEDKDNNLFPSQLPLLPDDGQSASGEPRPPRKRYGYPICWSQTGYEWYPYLPAVLDFQYPIFRGMSHSPEIVHDGSGYSLNEQQMLMWKNVEFVMVTVSNALSSGQIVSLEFQRPHFPSEYGYTRSHTQLKFAKKALTKSLNAFQRLLGFCAFSMNTNPTSAPLGPYGRFYSDSWVSELYKMLKFNDPDVHILAKLLLCTLWRMRVSGNYTGIVVGYNTQYDYPTVRMMFHADVPVYVAWPGPGVNPYARFRQHHALEDFVPTAKQFEALERPPIPEHHGVDPSPKGSQAYDRSRNELEEMAVSEPHEELCLALEEGELVDDADEPPPEEEAPIPQVANHPSFNNDRFLQALVDSQFSADVDLVNGWLNEEDFLWKRYGIRACSGQESHGLDKAFPMRLGLQKGPTDLSVHRLFQSLTSKEALPRDCDLSPGYHHTDGGFPRLSHRSVLDVQRTEDGYLVSVSVDGSTRLWRLLIEDPLTVLQIEREGWDLRSDGLVSSLVRKGIPFEVLYPSCQRSATFHPHPGPIIHPDGRFPTRADYLAYRIDVGEFFQRYPHAYAAALCSGGILWRVAVDVLPFPDERQILRPFHPSACHERVIDGQRYWTPRLNEQEHEEIVGMHKWAGKSGREEEERWTGSLSLLDPRQSAKHDSWWPKHTAWASSGLDFGAWAPADEAWYAGRKRGLAEGVGRAIQASVWKGAIKFERQTVRKLLAGARSVAREFFSLHRS